MKVIKHIARILVGITFIFSGYVKGIDPWGSTYKFTDYFNAMGMEWMIWAAFPLGIILALAEFTIGIALLFNIFIKFFSWLALLFMAIFLPLTLWVAIKNPVPDCGCFGDALIISNWETFYKNIALTVLSIIVVKTRKDMKCLFNQKIANALGILSIVVYCSSVFYSYNHLPVFDFRPYKVDVNIPDAMTVPIDAPQDVYKNIYYYENKNTGKIKKFNDENFPWQDTLNWKYSDSKTKLIKEGYHAPIHDFTIETPDGDNIIDFFMYDENYVFMLVAYNLEKSSLKPQDKINNLANWALENGLSFICLTSSLPDESAIFAEETGAPYEFFNCDEITLKTIIRSNPGLIVLKEGTIVGKWHYNDIPTPEKFIEEFPLNDVE